MRFVFVVALCLIALVGCGGGGPESVLPSSPQSASPSGWTSQVVGHGVYLDRYPFQRLRLTRPGKADTYAIWFKAPEASTSAPAPAVLLADPYAGIDWTGEPVDELTALQVGHSGPTLVEDTRSPGFDPRQPTYVPYELSVTDDAAASALAYLINGVSVIVSYARVYAGGALQNDIDDTLAALGFLYQQGEVDRARIGVWGSSYGGALVLHASSQIRTTVAPVVGAAITPIVDWQAFVAYAQWMVGSYSDPGKAILRFSPYSRRALDSSADGALLSAYNGATLRAGLRTRFLFIHDAFDTIAPLFQAQDVFSAPEAGHRAFIYPHEGMTLDWQHVDITHAPVAPGYEQASAVLFSQSHMLTRLMPSTAPVILLPRLPGLDLDLFAHLKAQGALGYDIARNLRPVLLELCDPRVQLVDYADGFAARESGRHFVAGLIRSYWLVDVDESNVVDWLLTDKL